MTDMFKNVTLSTPHYDALLNGWNSQSLKNNVNFNAGNSAYCSGEASRLNMIDHFNWNITDGGLNCSFDPMDYFVTTWQTTVPNETITIPTTGSGYNYVVDWGDGTVEPNRTGNAIHGYASPGIHTVKISLAFPQIYFNNSGDKLKIRSIEQWGTNVWNSMNSAFMGCENLISNATDTPNLSLVTDMYGMFAYARNFNGDSNFGNWDVSNVTNMYGMFAGASVFNHNINAWNVGNVTDMENIFYGATWFNQPLNNWDVSNVENMDNMFRTAIHFNQDLSGWDVGSATTMKYMFAFAIRFDQNLGNWNVGNVKNMISMFKGVMLSTSNYDGLLNGWSAIPLNNNVRFSGGNSNYCAGEAARQSMIDNFNWSITDGGLECEVGIKDDALVIGDHSNMFGVNLYPNPVRDVLILGNPKMVHLDNVSIYDLSGRLILQVDLNDMGSEQMIDFSKLSGATYMVIIQGAQDQLTKLIVKE